MLFSVIGNQFIVAGVTTEARVRDGCAGLGAPTALTAMAQKKKKKKKVQDPHEGEAV